jgi:hypothetical protein
MTLETSFNYVSDSPSCGVTQTTLEESFMLLDNINSAGVTHDYCNLKL